MSEFDPRDYDGDNPAREERSRMEDAECVREALYLALTADQRESVYAEADMPEQDEMDRWESEDLDRIARSVRRQLHTVPAILTGSGIAEVFGMGSKS